MEGKVVNNADDETSSKAGHGRTNKRIQMMQLVAKSMTSLATVCSALFLGCMSDRSFLSAAASYGKLSGDNGV
jgi:hypothetical protein